MLKSIQISNYALIDELSMALDKGLTIVSGETGAGKSIILGALDLVMGKRADTSVLLDRSRKCIVEASFRISDYSLKPFFEENDLDYEDVSIIRREISPAGKSRAFINDTPVTLPVLQELGKQLIDIHSQHANILLATNRFQLKILDVFAGHSDVLETYSAQYSRQLELVHSWEDLREKAHTASADLDYLSFQHKELEEARLESGEQETLEQELETLTHAEEISSAMYQVWQLLSEQDPSAVSRLKESVQILRKIIPHYPEAEEHARRLESAWVDIQDVAQDLDRKGNDIEHDPQRLEMVKDRINLIYHLLEKHHLPDVDALIRLKQELSDQISRIASYDEDLVKLQQQLDESKEKLNALGKTLTENRKKAIPAIESEVTGMLRKLGMPAARFSVRHTRNDQPGPYGFDEVLFLFTANPQTGLQDLRKVASGGELSRLMLSLKSLLSASAGLPTIIFDEIDAGVSGDVADRVGEIIDKMGHRMQVVNITHLPQIASKGQHHYRVYKTTDNGHTYTRVKLLSSAERIDEIARLLSGRELSEAAVRNARELLGIGQEK